MLTLENGRIRFHWERCCQCGVCLPSCPTDALSLRWNARGHFDIECDHPACIVCGLCVKVCPPHWLPDDRATPEQVEGAEALYLAHAADDKVRWMSSSGGVARTVIRESLLRGLVDAVYSLTYPPVAGGSAAVPTARAPAEMAGGALPDRVLPTGAEVEGTWLTTPPPTQNIPGSIYRPVPWGSNLHRVDKAWRVVLLIGLPCQLKGAERLLRKRHPGLEVIKVAIFCRKQKVLGHSDTIKRLVGQKNAPTPLVFYRGGGWPGKSGVYSSGRILETGYYFHAKCWTLPACNLCPDCFGAETVDITLADPWGIVSEAEDPKGSNLVYVWTAKGDGLLRALGNALVMRDCPPAAAIRSAGFAAISAKVLALPFHLGTERSLLRRMRYSLAGLMRVAAEVELRFFAPSSLPMRIQQVAIEGIRQVLRWGVRLIRK